MKTVAASPILVGRYVVFGALDGKVYILNRDNGLALKGANLGAPILTTAAVAKDLLIFSDFSGNLSVFKLNL
jgi:outer membrane protein assembly factor BamB